MPAALDCRLLTIYTLARPIRNMAKSLAPRPDARRAPSRARAANVTPAPAPAAADNLALVRSSSLPTLVQRELERMILAGELAVGAKLNEASVAERLGVSRGPVREAFRALEAAGLVRLEKNRGVFVRQIDVDEADEIYELRAVLDDYAARLAAQNAGPLDIADLRARLDRMERAVGRGDLDAYHAANLAFHDRLIELAGNAKLLALYRRLVNELSLYRRATLDQTGIPSVSLGEHRAIVDCIAAGQAAAAGRLLREHVMASRERMHRKTGVALDAPRPRRARTTA
jgi:phosphonate utilization transcriptional regulator